MDAYDNYYYCSWSCNPKECGASNLRYIGQNIVIVITRFMLIYLSSDRSVFVIIRVICVPRKIERMYIEDRLY